MVDRKISNYVQEEKVAPTKVKALKGHHQPKKSKETNKAKGEKKTETKNTPAKASPTSAPPKKTKRVWRVNGVSFESSTPGPDESKIN
jgi:hypothetical protein